MKKVFDQTVRDLKRGVNKKVLKVPSVEQKVLDATSNEPWGPHGSLLADIAQASRNYNEYQMIMAVIWKRINDTGKNWRHVYKALTVLEYLVAHGSERVIDEIREHSYQISTLSEFQYVDSSGRDQGSNVRKKSQSLVALVNDKERIQEVREKAATNRDKYRNTSSGSMYRPGSYSNTGGYGDRYDDDRYGGRDDDRNGYGREREWGGNDDRYGKYGGDSYGHEGDRSREYDERYTRDGYRDDDYSGRSEYNSGSRSSDKERDHAYDDDGQYSSRESGAKAEDQSQGSASHVGLNRKYSEQNLGAPPSYEEAVGAAQSPTHIERDGETSSAHAPKSSSPPPSASPSQETTVPVPTPSAGSPPAPAPENKDINSFDEFDPRAAFMAAPSAPVPTTSTGIEMDLLGSLSDSFSSNTLALVPVESTNATSNGNPPMTASSEPSFAVSPASTVANQAFDDPFGDGPFKAISSPNDMAAQPPAPFPPSSSQSLDIHPSASLKVEMVVNSGGTLPVASYSPSDVSSVPLHSTNQQYAQQELSTSNQEIDILADILPPSGPSPTEYQVPTGQLALETVPLQAAQPNSQMAFPPQHNSQMGFPPQPTPVPQTGFGCQNGQTSLHSYSTQPGLQSQTSFQTGQSVQQMGLSSQTSQSPSLTGLGGYPAPPAQAQQTGFMAQSGQPASLTGFPPQAGFQAPGGQSLQQPNASFYGGYGTAPLGSTGPFASPMNPHVSTVGVQVPSQVTPQSSQIQINTTPAAMQRIPSASTGSLTTTTQPAKDKFETKSTIWTDTLNRGLVNLNISGSKTNPLADIGVDFEAINRKEKRMEKPTTTPVMSTVTMGKAMGSGSGIGRAGAGAGAGAFRPQQNPMVGPGMGMGAPGSGMVMGGPGVGMGMRGGFRGVNQPMGMGMGVGMNNQMNMGMGMGMGMNMGAAPGMNMQMQQPTGFPPGSNVAGGYNPMTGPNNYYGQQPYGGGYR